VKKIPLLFFLFSSFVAFGQTKVMTYNIRNSRANDGVNKWDKRKGNLFALIRSTDPDILGTQEVLYDQLKDLKKAFPEYISAGVGRNNGKHAGEHSALFFKKEKYEFLKKGDFWLSETPDIAGSKSWDAAITRICSWVQLKEKDNGKVFFVFNTHFDHKGKEARRKSAALLRTKIDSLAQQLPVIAMGDFNFTPNDSAYSIMTNKKSNKILLNDSYTIGAVPYTDCGFNVSNTHCSRIDYIFYSDAYSKSSYKVHTDNKNGYYPSDHCAVSVELK
jgi:endonuclease/exonuclease/phosphatase family metal-dependent hydrolase